MKELEQTINPDQNDSGLSSAPTEELARFEEALERQLNDAMKDTTGVQPPMTSRKPPPPPNPTNDHPYHSDDISSRSILHNSRETSSTDIIKQRLEESLSKEQSNADTIIPDEDAAAILAKAMASYESEQNIIAASKNLNFDDSETSVSLNDAKDIASESHDGSDLDTKPRARVFVNGSAARHPETTAPPTYRAPRSDTSSFSSDDNERSSLYIERSAGARIREHEHFAATTDSDHISSRQPRTYHGTRESPSRYHRNNIHIAERSNQGMRASRRRSHDSVGSHDSTSASGHERSYVGSSTYSYDDSSNGPRRYESFNHTSRPGAVSVEGKPKGSKEHIRMELDQMNRVGAISMEGRPSSSKREPESSSRSSSERAVTDHFEAGSVRRLPSASPSGGPRKSLTRRDPYNHNTMSPSASRKCHDRRDPYNRSVSPSAGPRRRSTSPAARRRSSRVRRDSYNRSASPASPSTRSPRKDSFTRPSSRERLDRLEDRRTYERHDRYVHDGDRYSGRQPYNDNRTRYVDVGRGVDEPRYSESHDNMHHRRDIDIALGDYGRRDLRDGGGYEYKGDGPDYQREQREYSRREYSDCYSPGGPYSRQEITRRDFEGSGGRGYRDNHPNHHHPPSTDRHGGGYGPSSPQQHRSYPISPSSERKKPIEVEIEPGVFMNLRGADETWTFIMNGSYIPAPCFSCGLDLLCVIDAEYILCPDCRVVGPVFEDELGMRAEYLQDSSKKVHGVGMGFKPDDLMRWQSEIARGVDPRQVVGR